MLADKTGCSRVAGLTRGCDAENAVDAIDILLTTALFAGLLRNLFGDSASFTAPNALALAIMKDTRATGMGEWIGSIEVGKQAELADGLCLQLIWVIHGRLVLYV